MIGSRLSQFQLTASLGRGGTGEVYLAAGNPSWDFSRVGRRFLMIRSSDPWSPNQLRVVLNWSKELDERIAPGG